MRRHGRRTQIAFSKRRTICSLSCIRSKTSAASWRLWKGAFVDAAHALINGRQTALENRIEGYRYLAKKALWASSEIHSTQADLVEIVNKAEEDIQAARDAAEKAKQAAAAVPGAAEAIEGQLKANIAGIVSHAAGLAQDSRRRGRRKGRGVDRRYRHMVGAVRQPNSA